MTDKDKDLIQRLKRMAKRCDMGAYNSNIHIADLLYTTIAALEAKQWQPIETAPKDGTRILLFTKMYGPSTGHWDAFNGSWVLHSVLNSEAEITHWQPLPTPPTEDE